MRQQTAENRINELFAQLIVEVKGSTALGLTDINKFCEDFLVPVLRRALDLPHLRNLNHTEKRNFPAIDLADDEAETAIQVTSTAEKSKVLDTLAKFTTHGLYTKYRRLLIYVLTEKHERYSETGVVEASSGRVDFEIHRDVLDYRDVLRALNGKPLEILAAVTRTLEKQFARASEWSLETEERFTPKEDVHLNLMKVNFPSTLYIADIDFGDDAPRSRGSRRSRTDLRKKIQDLLKQKRLRFSADWTCHGNQLISFHDLSDFSLPITKIVDQGTVTPLAPSDYYAEGEDQELVFKSLLHNCLKQTLFKKGIQWQDEWEMFIFVSTQEEQLKRQEVWGPSRTARTVYEKKPNKTDPTKTLHHKHLAFRRQFLHLGDEWFLVIKPEWFFSYDGYKKSRYGDKNVTWIKKREWNVNVFAHLRFLLDFLTVVPTDDLIDGKSPALYPFLTFASSVSFSDLPALPDATWLARETAERRKTIEGVQEEFDF